MSDKGFTLIELLIVSVIILALVFFSTPLFRRSFVNLELKETVSNISKFITLVQQRSIIDRKTYKIFFDFDKNTYQLLEEGNNIVPGRFGKIFYIPQDIEIDGSSKEIFFYPDGHCDNGNSELPQQVSLELTDKNKKTLTITTTGTLGNVVITEDTD